MLSRRLVVPLAAAAALAVATCARGFGGAWRLPAEPVAVEGRSAMVVSAHPLATAVGVEILQRGGNAVDAAVAVGFALAVVHPSAGNIGGGGFLIVRSPTGGVSALDFRETAPGAATRDMYVNADGALSDDRLIGHRSTGVPGTVAGLAEAHRRFGALPFGAVVSPAVALAEGGFVLDRARARSLAGAANRLARFDASRAQFLVDGKPPAEGTRLIQRDLGRTLRAIADGGPSVFYEGYVADLIVAEMDRGGGLITRDDLAAYRPQWRDPIEFIYRGHTVYSMPPSSSGGITVALILNILEGYDSLPAYGSAAHVHLLAETMRRAFVDRNHYLGDPAFVRMPVEDLISDEYASARRATIRPDRATPSADLTPGLREAEHTTHYSVVDPAGNAVAVTYTINTSYGSGVTVAGAGFLLNNEMDDFTSAPGKPNTYGLIQGEANAIAPRKRMLSSMMPTIVLNPRAELMLVLGTPGGSTIITTLAQVISNVIDHRMSLTEAVAAPRVHHQAQPDRVQIERGGMRADVARQLRAMGHAVRERGFSGEVSAIAVHGGLIVGVADPRRGGGAAGY